MSTARSKPRRMPAGSSAPHLPLDGLQNGANQVAAPSQAPQAFQDYAFQGHALHDRAFQDVDELERALSQPSAALIESLAQLDGDILVLGAGGKMGPSLARMARRAADAANSNRRVIGVSRFSSPGEYAKLKACGVEALRGDLLDPEFVRTLPDVKNVLYLVGMKFGSGSALPETWAINAYLPGVIASRFPESRIVALSTGNVYGFTPAQSSRGAVEDDGPEPTGEYAMSALGRERVFQYFSQAHGAPLTLVRLTYATELRYGVLVDLARKVYFGEPISLEMGYFNAIWQRDACDVILRAFSGASTPATVLNVTGAERLSCREVCERFGKLFGRSVRFTGVEAPTALLCDAGRSIDLFGAPEMPLERMLALTADWIERGGETWNKPTHFQVRNGKY